MVLGAYTTMHAQTKTICFGDYAIKIVLGIGKKRERERIKQVNHKSKRYALLKAETQRVHSIRTL